MSQEPQAAAQDAAEQPPAPEQPRHTHRHRSRKAQQAVQETAGAETPAETPEADTDLSDRAREVRAAIKSTPIYTDPSNGIRIVVENEIAPREVARRVRIEFAKKPPAEERQIVKTEGFIWNDNVEAWVMDNGPKARELAKKAVNLVYKHRGIDTSPVVTPMGGR